MLLFSSFVFILGLYFVYLFVFLCCFCVPILSCGKILYRCTSTFLALSYCSGIFVKSLSYLYEAVRKLFRRFFGLFAIFDRNFSKIVAPPNKGHEDYVMQMKEHSSEKKL